MPLKTSHPYVPETPLRLTKALALERPSQLTPTCLSVLGTPGISPPADPLLPLQTDTNSLLGALGEQNTLCCSLLSKDVPSSASWNSFTHVFLSGLSSHLEPGGQSMTPWPSRLGLRSPEAGIWRLRPHPALRPIASARRFQKHCREEAHTNRESGPPRRTGTTNRLGTPPSEAPGSFPHARQQEDAFHLVFPYLLCLPRSCLGQLSLHWSSHCQRLL